MESQLSTLIKENLQLRKENKEMKDRMTILNRVIEEMLDQQDIKRNSSQVLNERHWEDQVLNERHWLIWRGPGADVCILILFKAQIEFTYIEFI